MDNSQIQTADSVDVASVIPLRAYQKVVDIPSNMPEGSISALRGLAIGSMISSILLLLLTTNVFTFLNAYVGLSCILAFLPVLMALLGSCIILHNTNRWAQTDVCCNLMRPQAACCTRCCMSYKHCCARTSSIHIAASVFSGIALLGLGFLFIGNLVEIHYDYKNGYNYNGYVDNMPRSDYGYNYYYSDYMYIDDMVLPTSTTVRAKAQPQYATEAPEPYLRKDYTSKPDTANVIRARPIDRVHRHSYSYYPSSAGVGVVVQQILGGLCTMILLTTLSISSFLLRRAENDFVAPMLLPQNKMIILSVDQPQSNPATAILANKMRQQCQNAMKMVVV